MFGGNFINFISDDGSARLFQLTTSMGHKDQLLVYPGVDPSSCLFSFWVFILPLFIFVCLHCIPYVLYFLHTGFCWTVWILVFLVGGLFHEVKGPMPRLWINSIGTSNRVAMTAIRRMSCRPDHETHDFRGSSDRCYRIIIPTDELLYSDFVLWPYHDLVFTCEWGGKTFLTGTGTVGDFVLWRWLRFP